MKFIRNIILAGLLCLPIAAEALGPNSFGYAPQNIITANHAGSPYTLAIGNDLVLVDTTGGSVTITLPNPASYSTVQFKDIKGNFGTTAPTIQQCGAESIEGLASSITLNANWGNYFFSAADATNWYKLSASSNRGYIDYTTAGSYTWTAPAGVTSVGLCGRAGADGGGGGGAGGGGSTSAGAAGGGSGSQGASRSTYCITSTVTPGTAYPITIGAGGTAGTAGSVTAANSAGSTGGTGGTGGLGGSTSFGSIATWWGTGIGYTGGEHGTGGTISTGGTGGGSATVAGAGDFGLNVASGVSGGAPNTAGTNGTATISNPAKVPLSGVWVDGLTAGTGGSAGGTNGGGGGGGQSIQVGGDLAPNTAANGGNGGASGSNGSAGQTCPTSTAGMGGAGGVGGGGGGLLASTGSQGGAGQAGCAGSAGHLAISWQE